MTDDQRKRQINSEFMEYMGSFVTKGNTKSLPGTVNQIKEDAERKKNLAKIKQQGDDAEEFEPDVKDIAKYVQKQLYIGWKTTN